MDKMSSKVHRVRYYNPKPQPINCASLNKFTKQLAIARGDASLEIWDLNFSPCLLKFIPSIENGSVEALCWVKDRLFSTGLSGALLEWNLETLVIKTTTMLTGYAAWCLDVSPDDTLVAVGTEQGYINLFNVENDGIEYQKLFDKQEGRILCCKFDTTGKVLATGSLNTIRVWNVTKGQATSRISVKRRGNEVIVWCLAFLSDSKLVSGDSLGRLTFWDSNIGDQIESFATHKADITSLVVSEDEQNIYCSGVDPVIIHFVKVQHSTDTSKAKMHWVKNVQMHMHEHDVRALLTLGRELISVGIDGYLTFSSFPPKWVMRVPPMLPPPRSAVCAKKKLLLLRFSNYLEVWKLGTYETNESGQAVTKTNHTNGHVNSTEYDTKTTNCVEQDSTDAMYRDASLQNKKICLKVTEKPIKLISVQTKKKKQMFCCELSPTGEYIFYSTSTDIRLLKLETDDEHNIFVSKLLVSGVKPPCDRVAFTHDGRLLVAHTPGALHVLQVDPDAGATLVQTISTEKHLKAKTLLHLVISKETSSGGTYLVAADTKSGLALWKQNGKKFEPHTILPTYQCVPSALTVSDKGILYIVYTDQSIVEYDVDTLKLTEWPPYLLPDWWHTRTAAVHTVTAHPTRNAVLMQDQNSLWVFEKEQQEESRPIKKGRPQNAHPNGELRFKIIPIKYLSGFHWVGDDEAVTLELLPANILAQLPSVVVQKNNKTS